MASNRASCLVAVLAISFGLPLAARAGGDAGAGDAQIRACQACHVTDSVKGDLPPRLAGQRASYLARQLKAFRSGDRKHRLMNPITQRLSDADIESLASYWSAQPAGSDAIVPAEVAAVKKSKMEFPRDFPDGFISYATINKRDEGIVVKAYVNKVGFQAARAGKQLPAGSAIILEIYPAKLDAEGNPVVDKNGGWLTGELRQYHGMETRAGWGDHIPGLLRNQDWNYTMFTPDKAPRADINQASCLSCHLPAASTGFVHGLRAIQARAAAK